MSPRSLSTQTGEAGEQNFRYHWGKKAVYGAHGIGLSSRYAAINGTDTSKRPVPTPCSSVIPGVTPCADDTVDRTLVSKICRGVPDSSTCTVTGLPAASTTGWPTFCCRTAPIDCPAGMSTYDV